jgi:hypothetical protein
MLIPIACLIPQISLLCLFIDSLSVPAACPFVVCVTGLADRETLPLLAGGTLRLSQAGSGARLGLRHMTKRIGERAEINC